MRAAAREVVAEVLAEVVADVEAALMVAGGLIDPELRQNSDALYAVLEDSRVATPDTDAAEEAAAVAIQSGVRGMLARRESQQETEGPRPDSRASGRSSPLDIAAAAAEIDRHIAAAASM
jgi:hypothetical protein